MWTQRDLAGRSSVLFFYPGDFTPGCTREAGAYARAWPDLQAAGVSVFGVSRDSVANHEAFGRRHCLPFTLLADDDGAMTDAFGATIFGSLPRRVSYLVDAELRVAARFDSQLRPEAHAQKMVEAVHRHPHPRK